MVHEEKNYITPAGFRRLQAELKDLRMKQRPEMTEVVAWAASNGDRSENADYHYGKRKLRQIDSRIRFLTKRIEAAEIIDPGSVSSKIVKFGATVTILNEKDEEKTYSIVGEDESDLSKGLISWKSPLARALMKRESGDMITFTTPSGPQDIEIVAVEFKSIE